MKTIVRSALAACVLGASLAVSAADERMENAVEARQGLLKVVRAYFGPMAGMARGDIPYDAERMRDGAHHVKELASMLPYLFRGDTRGSGVETDALDGIWENMDDFRAKAEDLEAAATELEAAVAEGRSAAIAAFRNTGGKCKACHDEYRAEN